MKPVMPRLAVRTFASLCASLTLVAATAAAGPATTPSMPMASPESQGFSSERLKALEEYIQTRVTNGDLPGAVTLLARHGKIVEYKAYGKAAVDANVPLARDAIFRVYSQTKVVTGVAMMILFEQGKWRFDDPVTKFVPEFKDLRVYKGTNPDGTFQSDPIKRPPTMRELLTHTAGFGYGLSSDDFIEKAYSDSDYMIAPDSTEALKRIAAIPLHDQPGEHWRYSSSVDIQGYIIERISGQKLGDFMRTHIFEPLKMTDTAFWVPPEKTSRFVHLYGYDEKTRGLVDPHNNLVFDYSKPPGAGSGGAGLVSTAMDYARFTQMLVRGGELEGARILAPGTVKLMASNHVSDEIRAHADEAFNARSGMGFGVDVSIVLDQAKAGSLAGLGTYNWGGAAGTWFWIDPTNDVVFVGMIQVMNRWSAPHLNNLDNDTQVLVYGALTKP